jgi:hypothetical protein
MLLIAAGQDRTAGRDQEAQGIDDVPVSLTLSPAEVIRAGRGIAVDSRKVGGGG